MPKLRDPEQNRLIGRNLKALRLERGLSLQAVAGMLDISYQQLHKYEKGENRLPLSLVPALSDFFGVSSDVFFGNDAGSREGQEEDDLLSLCARVAAVQDPGLRRKIRRVVEILAA